MIYHVCPPDILFVRYCLERFEKIKPGVNRCIIIVSKHHLKPKHNIDNNLIDYFGQINTGIIKKINNSGCTAVVIHTLNDDILELALNLKEKIPVIWRSWGPDLHDLLYRDFKPLLPYTIELIKSRNIFIESIKKNLRPVRELVLNKASLQRARLLNKAEFLRRISFIATTTKTEYNLLTKQIPGIKAKYIQLNYRPFELHEISGAPINSNHNTIMVGHSSFPYHNHADVFFQLSGFPGFEFKTVVPLNYGNAKYRKKVIALGRKLLNPHSRYLIDFLPIDDYVREISRCDSFILNSKVQSGGANVIYSLLNGLKVYLREENPVYQDFIKAGLIMFSIQNDLNRDHLNDYRLSDSEKRENLKIMRSLFNPEKEIENARDLYTNLNIVV